MGFYACVGGSRGGVAIKERKVSLGGGRARSDEWGFKRESMP